ncbi:MAG TPA: hypothetical protein VLB09_02585, partial [Nitrospiria bacterium]|nr:hypothetical protein [Nitrospiria bacterium]
VGNIPGWTDPPTGKEPQQKLAIDDEDDGDSLEQGLFEDDVGSNGVQSHIPEVDADGHPVYDGEVTPADRESDEDETLNTPVEASTSDRSTSTSSSIFVTKGTPRRGKKEKEPIPDGEEQPEEQNFSDAPTTSETDSFKDRTPATTEEPDGDTPTEPRESGHCTPSSPTSERKEDGEPLWKSGDVIPNSGGIMIMSGGDNTSWLWKKDGEPEWKRTWAGEILTLLGHTSRTEENPQNKDGTQAMPVRRRSPSPN